MSRLDELKNYRNAVLYQCTDKTNTDERLAELRGTLSNIDKQIIDEMILEG